MTSIVPSRPTTGTSVALSKVARVSDLFDRADVKQRMIAALPRHMNPDRMLRVAALAAHSNALLKQCDPMTFLGALLACSSLGLEPNTPLQHAYLIPRKNNKKNTVDVTLIVGYRGYLDLARRSGHLIGLHADVVYDGDDFSFEYGTDEHLRHRPAGGRQGREPLQAYCHARMTSGQTFDVWSYDDVLRIRDRHSDGYKQAVRARAEGKEWLYAASPWVAHEHAMACKTMIRQVAKQLPLSVEMANAGVVDDKPVNFRAVAEDTGWLENGGDIGMVPELEPPPEVPETPAERAVETARPVEVRQPPKEPEPPLGRVDVRKVPAAPKFPDDAKVFDRHGDVVLSTGDPDVYCRRLTGLLEGPEGEATWEMNAPSIPDFVRRDMETTWAGLRGQDEPPASNPGANCRPADQPAAGNPWFVPVPVKDGEMDWLAWYPLIDAKVREAASPADKEALKHANRDALALMRSGKAKSWYAKLAPRLE